MLYRIEPWLLYAFILGWYTLLFWLVPPDMAF